jgi:hypothetical protein
VARSGDRAGAERQVAACEELFAREVGMRPAPEFGLAAREGEDPGAAVLHEALALAGYADERRAAGMACRELGYIDVQAARNASGGRWLAKATELATSDGSAARSSGFAGWRCPIAHTIRQRSSSWSGRLSSQKDAVKPGKRRGRSR